ncbi:hypothetical protein GCM10029964_078170 [Kibdelosporangium lantanae]
MDLVADLAARLPEYMVPATVVVLPEIPLTPNGKVDRRALPAPALPGVRNRPRTPREELLRTLVAETLGLDEVGVDQDFFSIGGDSISSVELVSSARRAGLTMTVQDVFRHRTVEALAAAMPESGPALTQDEESGEFAPTPIMVWLRERGGDFAGYNQAVAVRVPAGVTFDDLAAALRAVVERHAALRMRLTVESDGWRLTNGSATDHALLRRVDVLGLGDEELAKVVAHEGESARSRLAPTEGMLLQAVWFDHGPGRDGRLLVVAHHLAVDAVSWRIVLSDLASAWRQVVAGRTAELDPVPTSLRTWARALTDAATRPRYVAELAWWRRTLRDGEPRVGRRPLDPAVDVAGTVQHLSATLPTSATEPLLARVPAAFHAATEDVLLTGLALAVGRWRRTWAPSAGTDVLVDLEGHGRHEIVPGMDLSRTVGWFTTLHPVRLDPGDDRTPGAALKAVKEQLRAVPGKGIGYGLLRYLNPRTATELAGYATPQVAFNYLGRVAASGEQGPRDWDLAFDVDVPAHQDDSQAVPHLLEINAGVHGRSGEPRLEVVVSWPRELLTEPQVRELVDAWFAALRALAGQPDDPAVGGHTPSDLSFGLAQDEIDDLEAELGSME